METNEKILALVKERGPVLPVHISKEISDDILMTSARLSELLSNKQIKISSLKVGGSPLYYASGQEIKLQNFAVNLSGKEKDAYDLLRSRKVLKDSNQEPAFRVALRQIKDFAVLLQVNYNNKAELFWKWYLLGNNETKERIKEILEYKIEKKEEINPLEPKNNIMQETLLKENQREKADITRTNTEIPNELYKKEEKIEKSELKHEIKKDKTRKAKDDISIYAHNFFDKNSMNIVSSKEIKKNMEIDFVVELQTTIGRVKYFCKLKHKKRVNESDLSTAFIQAQSKGLPLLFLTKGKLTKKAQEMLGTEFKNIIFKEI